MVASLHPSQDDGVLPGVHRYNCCAGSVVQYFTDPSRLDGYSLFFLKGREGEEDNETTKPNETQQNKIFFDAPRIHNTLLLST